jgi:hypothetical protein
MKRTKLEVCNCEGGMYIQESGKKWRLPRKEKKRIKKELDKMYFQGFESGFVFEL